MPNEQGSAQVLQTERPLISFIIPVWNLPQGLVAECVDSLFQLNLDDGQRQVIIVDDGSDTPVLQELEPWVNRVHYIRHPHSGLSVARNIGLSVAEGQWIQFVDGDDLLLTTPYKHCIQLMEEGHADLVLFQFTDNDSHDTQFVDAPGLNGAAYLVRNNLRGSACGYAFKRHILGDLRFTPNTLHEDEEFTPLLFLSADQIIETSAQAYCYRQRSESIIHQQDPTHIDKRLVDAEAIIFRLNHKAQTLPLHMRNALERRVAQLTMDLLYNTIRTTHSWKRIQSVTERLRAKGLFPLPARHYTQKYWLFAQLTRTASGRWLAFSILSLGRRLDAKP
jgi:glycosyltransferase involved in cell wall biosynthesis